MFTIEIVADVVCPWCYIGTRRLAAAVEMIRQERADFQYRKRWLPFFLNPDTPPEGEPYLPFLEKKFGRDKVEQMWARVREAGRAWGIDYAFEKIQYRANTLKAHRLIHRAQTVDPDPAKIDALIERLYAAQFQRGEHIGDIDVLTACAAECGYDAPAIRAYLASNADEDVVKRMAAEVQAMGINQVPTFILPGQRIIVGAEDPAILAAGIREALAAG
ncbi:MAG: DsbA family oxidoreductase [Rhodocyclaceae bacterium]|jgi:predicted DsbA family dithiol-disulfide isomerase|nr:DsbA family oxidoreductase [Rhodocyclaceae bacterium]